MKFFPTDRDNPTDDVDFGFTNLDFRIWLLRFIFFKTHRNGPTDNKITVDIFNSLRGCSIIRGEKLTHFQSASLAENSPMDFIIKVISVGLFQSVGDNLVKLKSEMKITLYFENQMFKITLYF